AEADACYSAALTVCEERFARSEIWQLKLVLAGIQSQFDACIAVGTKALHELGLTLSSVDIDQAAMEAEVRCLQDKLASLHTDAVSLSDTLINLHTSSDPVAVKRQQILADMLASLV
ncbi:MAG: hypothetical protein ACK56I_12690, partial [bacterium]